MGHFRRASGSCLGRVRRRHQQFPGCREEQQAPQLTGDARVRWPLAHRDDLAQLYVLTLERGQPSADYHGVAESDVRVADIAGAIACRFDAPEPIVETVVARKGAWTACEDWDQTMAAPATRALLGWEPVRPGILESLQITR